MVDDTAEIRRLLRMTLEFDGRFFVVEEAGDGAAAVRMAGEHHPDAVILDLAMPVMDGLQAIPKIKERSPETKILVLSGFDSRQMSGEALARGADAYIEKGEDLDKLTATLVQLVEGTQSGD